MSKIIVFGNSGSGKSTLSKKLADEHALAHLDLDTIAWLDSNPPQRMVISESQKSVDEFLQGNQRWVVEGCYADLIELVTPFAHELIYLNLPVALCIENAKKRPWEPHKYASKEAQDADLSMLIDWISRYSDRDDVFSQQAHERLYKAFEGKKTMYCSNDR